MRDVIRRPAALYLATLLVVAGCSGRNAEQRNAKARDCLVAAGFDLGESLGPQLTSDDKRATAGRCLGENGHKLDQVVNAESNVLRRPTQAQERRCFEEGGWQLGPESNWANPIIMATLVPMERRAEFADAWFRCAGEPSSNLRLRELIMSATEADAQWQVDMNEQHDIDDEHGSVGE